MIGQSQLIGRELNEMRARRLALIKERYRKIILEPRQLIMQEYAFDLEEEAEEGAEDRRWKSVGRIRKQRDDYEEGLKTYLGLN